MLDSRSVEDLHPLVAKKARALVAKAKAEGIELRVTSTLRDHERQAQLYAQGRSAPGKKVTNAKPGQSWHNWGVAFDVCPIVNGEAEWGDKKLWNRIGELGEACGLEWAGRWKSFPEMAHFQFTAGLTLADFQAGKQLPTMA